MSDFPDMVYRTPGPHRAQNGGTFGYLGVNNADEMQAALSDGWYLTVDAAFAALDEEVTEAIDDVSPATREELEQKARELGIGFNARTTDAVLAQRIAERV
jgi:butyrate kinase